MNHEKLKNSRDHGCEIIRDCFVVPPTIYIFIICFYNIDIFKLIISRKDAKKQRITEYL